MNALVILTPFIVGAFIYLAVIIEDREARK